MLIDRRFYVELDASAVDLHVLKIPPSRVQYQCISRDDASVRMYLEVGDALCPEDVGGFFANLTNTPVECTSIRSQKRCRKVWTALMQGSKVTESGRHSFFPPRKPAPPAFEKQETLEPLWVPREVPAPSTAVDSRLLAERARLCKRLAEPPAPVPTELEQDSPDVALACARDAFDDLKRRMLAMDLVIQHRTFLLLKLRDAFAVHRAKAELRAGGGTVGCWERWTVLPQDEALQAEVDALRQQLQRAEAQREADACCEGGQEYRDIKRFFSPSGLRAVLWEQHAALTRMDRQIRRAEEACGVLEECF